MIRGVRRGYIGYPRRAYGKKPPVVHLVPEGSPRALCGAAPSPRSLWMDPRNKPGLEPCEACVRREDEVKNAANPRVVPARTTTRARTARKENDHGREG